MHGGHVRVGGSVVHFGAFSELFLELRFLSGVQLRRELLKGGDMLRWLWRFVALVVVLCVVTGRARWLVLRWLVRSSLCVRARVPGRGVAPRGLRKRGPSGQTRRGGFPIRCTGVGQACSRRSRVRLAAADWQAIGTTAGGISRAGSALRS